MRELLSPPVFQPAAAGAAVTAFACWSRLALWSDRPAELTLLATVLSLAAFALWAFVFAWHERYSGRPALDFDFQPRDWLAATLLGGAGGLLMFWGLDPALRPLTPEAYPETLSAWLSQLLFSLAFAQLFLCFAPVAFFERLLPPRAACAAAVGFALLVSYLKLRGLPEPVAPPTGLAILAARAASAGLAVWLFRRGGIALVSWWTALLELRHLAALL